MENFVQNILAAEIKRQQESNEENKSEATNPQLQLLQINLLMQTICQERLRLIQQLQQHHPSFPEDIAPPSPPGSSVAEDQTVTEASIEHPEDLTVEETYPQETTEESIVADPVEDEPTAAKPSKVRIQPTELRKRIMGVSLPALNFSGPLEVDLTYHENMARSFSTEERTPEQRMRRLRNTQAARVSRAKTRAVRDLLEKECTEATEKNTNYKTLVAQKRVYIGALLKLLGLPAKDLSVEWEKQEKVHAVSSAQAQ